jgi:tRNA (guanosine-2'-O-)-methyltransferase
MVSPERLARIQKIKASRQQNLAVVLEDIYDPHNAAAIFRTCDAYAVGSVHLIFDKQEPFNPKKVGKSSSATANKWLDFKIHKKTSDCLQKLKQNRYKIIATVLNKEAKDVYQFSWPKKIALLVGNEHFGLSKTAIELSDYQVYIPMQGMVQSLNVSVATAVFLSEIKHTLS